MKQLKKGCVLINTARGGLVENGALLSALKSGRIAAAGLDVIDGENILKEEKKGNPKLAPGDMKKVSQAHMLLKRDDVFVTAHNAFNTQEALTRILDTTIQNIKAFNRKRPINKVKR